MARSVDVVSISSQAKGYDMVNRAREAHAKPSLAEGRGPVGLANATVAVGSQIQKTTYQGHDASGQFRGTQVFVRKGDGWAMVSLHLSPIGQPPAWTGAAR